MLDSVSPHRPAFRVKTAGAHGYFAQFARGSGGPGAGKRNPDGTAYRGRFLDVIQLAHVLDGVDSGDLGDHLEAFGFDRLDLPAAVTSMSKVPSRWPVLSRRCARSPSCSTRKRPSGSRPPADRARGYGRVDIGGLVSPAGLAAEIPRKAGVTPPLVKFATPDDAALSRWMGAHRGGWLSAEMAGKGLFPAVDVDVHSAYPAFAALLGWWRLMTAARSPAPGQDRGAAGALCRGGRRRRLGVALSRAPGAVSASRSARSSATVSPGRSRRPTTTTRRVTPGCARCAAPSLSRSRGPMS